jgi:predicted phage tail protein
VNYLYSTDNGATYQPFNPSATGSPVVIAGLVNGTTYQIRLRAVNSVGDGAPSSALLVTPATTPAAPTITTVTPGNGWATVTFTPPVDDGGKPIINYMVQYSITGGTTWATFSRPASTAPSVTVTGLTRGVAHRFRVVAVNGLGAGAFSAASGAVVPASPPGLPRGLAVAGGNAQATLSWQPPLTNGGSPVTRYVVRYSVNGGASWSTYPHASSAATSITVTGLGNGVRHIFQVAAAHDAGTGLFTAPSAAVIPAGPAGAAAAPTASRGNGSATVTWGVPASNGGAAITNYVVQRSSNGGASWVTVPRAASLARSAVVAGLVNGTSYVFRVAAVTRVGLGRFSDASAAVIPATRASVPRALTVTPGNGQARLAWAAPASNGGLPVTNYVVQYSRNNGATWLTFARPQSAATSTTVTGLLNGVAWTFRVAAVNGVGLGGFSPVSTGVIPRLSLAAAVV